MNTLKIILKIRLFLEYSYQIIILITKFRFIDIFTNEPIINLLILIFVYPSKTLRNLRSD